MNDCRPRQRGRLPISSYRGIYAMKLRRYCVTVMDNWTPTRRFWTRSGARNWARHHNEYYSEYQASHAHVFQWDGKAWVEIAS